MCRRCCRSSIRQVHQPWLILHLFVVSLSLSSSCSTLPHPHPGLQGDELADETATCTCEMKTHRSTRLTGTGLFPPFRFCPLHVPSLVGRYFWCRRRVSLALPCLLSFSLRLRCAD